MSRRKRVLGAILAVTTIHRSMSMTVIVGI